MSREYVTEIYHDGPHEPQELQVMHKHAMTELEPEKPLYVDAACRHPGCGESTPRPMTTKDGSDWIMRHGEEAHGNPYIGAKWTSVREPDMKAEAAQLGGSGPRPDQNPERNQSMSTATTWAPTRAELDQATARTQATIASNAPPADRLRAAELEEAAHNGYLQRPGADAELQRAAEREWEAGG